VKRHLIIASLFFSMPASAQVRSKSFERLFFAGVTDAMPSVLVKAYGDGHLELYWSDRSGVNSILMSVDTADVRVWSDTVRKVIDLKPTVSKGEELEYKLPLLKSKDGEYVALSRTVKTGFLANVTPYFLGGMDKAAINKVGGFAKEGGVKMFLKQLDDATKAVASLKSP
jgi:hypothetical protein